MRMGAPAPLGTREFSTRMLAPAPPVTREFAFTDPSIGVLEDLPLDQPPCAKSVGEYEPEQIHITLGGALALCLDAASKADGHQQPVMSPVMPALLGCVPCQRCS